MGGEVTIVGTPPPQLREGRRLVEEPGTRPIKEPSAEGRRFGFPPFPLRGLVAEQQW